MCMLISWYNQNTAILPKGLRGLPSWATTDGSPCISVRGASSGWNRFCSRAGHECRRTNIPIRPPAALHWWLLGVGIHLRLSKSWGTCSAGPQSPKKTEPAAHRGNLPDNALYWLSSLPCFTFPLVYRCSWDHLPNKPLHSSLCLRVCFWESPSRDRRTLPSINKGPWKSDWYSLAEAVSLLPHEIM